MINYTSNLFILNPLTAIFLSGVATQITFILFFNNVHTVIKKSTLIYSNSDRRIKLWQQMFNDYCCKYYEKYSELFEKAGYHIQCIERTEIPNGDWICMACAQNSQHDVGIEGYEFSVED
jgi:hypothetical protein